MSNQSSLRGYVEAESNGGLRLTFECTRCGGLEIQYLAPSAAVHFHPEPRIVENGTSNTVAALATKVQPHHDEECMIATHDADGNWIRVPYAQLGSLSGSQS